MKLGLWNRLAVVATGLALIIAPAAIWLDADKASTENQVVYHELCLTIAEGDYKRNPDADAYEKALNACNEQAIQDAAKFGPGWDFWWEAVGATAFGCVVLYLLLWAVAATGEWVWRGRGIRTSLFHPVK